MNTEQWFAVERNMRADTRLFNPEAVANQTSIAASGSCSSLGLGLGSAEARTFDVPIESSGLAELNILFEFDFINGGPPPNTVTLGSITSVSGA
jgi:hypothetical protein